MDTRIPKRFQLLGQIIEIEQADHIASSNGTLGEARPDHNSIVLQRSVEGFPLPESRKIHVMWHEIFHHILFAMGHKEVAEDEAFVDLIAGMVHQVISTMEYDEVPVKKGTKRGK